LRRLSLSERTHCLFGFAPHLGFRPRRPWPTDAQRRFIVVSISHRFSLVVVVAGVACRLAAHALRETGRPQVAEAHMAVSYREWFDEAKRQRSPSEHG
jgi:hypothetical protein